MTSANTLDYQVFDAGNLALQSGLTYRGAKLAYKTYGTLNATRSNAVVYCTPFGAHHTDIEFMVAPGAALDPTRYFIIVPNMFGNGLSSSPSNTPAPYDKSRYPHFTPHDNVAAQHKLLTDVFGITTLQLVYGWRRSTRRWSSVSACPAVLHVARRTTLCSSKVSRRR